MSLAIDVDRVTGVLLADGWHLVADESFDLDAYEFTLDGDCIHGGGSSGVCATTFGFKTADGHRVFGPLTAILAISAD